MQVCSLHQQSRELEAHRLADEVLIGPEVPQVGKVWRVRSKQSLRQGGSSSGGDDTGPGALALAGQLLLNPRTHGLPGSDKPVPKLLGCLYLLRQHAGTPENGSSLHAVMAEPNNGLLNLLKVFKMA